MPDQFREQLRQMPDAKKIAVAIYGEQVAAYRYGVLADKALNERHRAIFLEMQEEENEHEARLRDLAHKRFPDADFVLSDKDKEMVIVGTRMLEVTDTESFNKAMQFLHDTEKRTGLFYQVMHELLPDGELGDFLNEMAEECQEHAESLLAIKP